MGLGWLNLFSAPLHDRHDPEQDRYEDNADQGWQDNGRDDALDRNENEEIG